MKRGFLSCVVLWSFVALVSVSGGEGDSIEWKVLKKQHFVVYYTVEEPFTSELARQAEALYEQIVKDLGFTRHDNFWLWENRATLRIYPTREAFRKATRAPGWAVGEAAYPGKEISTFRHSEGFMNRVLVHEMTHLVFRDFMGAAEVPFWLNEGLAQWEEIRGPECDDARVHAKMTGQAPIPLTTLFALTLDDAREPEQAARVYAQSASLVGYLAGVHGPEKFRKFCGQLRDGKTVEEALRFTYTGTFRTIDDLERGWKQHLAAGK